MTINTRRARTHLQNFDFKSLFVEELGWGRANGKSSSVAVDGGTFRLAPVAELGGMIVYQCNADEIPAPNIRKKIDKEVSKLAFEHIIIFTDTDRTKSVWQWVKREVGQSARERQVTYEKGASGDLLLSKLAGIAFDFNELDEEGRVSIAAVTGKVAKAFDVEKVTKKFYEEFKTEHAQFLKFVKGIEDTGDRAWYTSVMLNRLMFIYFIQKKGFLDNDRDYLPHKLKETKATGKDRFYRHFLRKLFFEGFAQEEADRSKETQKLLGKIPYLNGGLFLEHSLEAAHGDDLQIPDSVFEHLFEFFDGYQWHLDDRALHDDREINPDVLGYIFEKYINQKQMGAYYTKEDITGYICRNTILPFLFDKLGRLHYDAVHPLPIKDVEPYIYPAVKQKDYLPTETEREYNARQKRYQQIKADFKAGKIANINDLITYNLNIERFAQDWLAGLDNPVTLRACYFECLTKLTVLDPTVGSGAFLFAAMNILEPLYEICLDKMEGYDKRKYADFADELKRIADHPNRRYFIFKSIIVNNLYGVDIMEEATEICKLRLFLKLVAQVEEADSIEPLPDIDFNIRAGNTLVGYTTLDQIRGASLFGFGVADKIREADAALRSFRNLQTQRNISARALAKAKSDTKTLLAAINGELNETLQQEYGAKKLETFVKSHQPFHWYVEFNGIMQDGGFDVIVGNPPYVEYSKIKKQYTLLSFYDDYSTNLYSACCYRATQIKSSLGFVGFIVPVSLPSTDRMQPLREVIANKHSVHIVSFSTRPSKLFEGAEQRLSIYVQSPSSNSTVFSGGYLKWGVDERARLFETIEYVTTAALKTRNFIWPKIRGQLHYSIITKLLQQTSLDKSGILGQDKYLFYKNTGIRYFSTVTLRAPKCWINGVPSPSSRETTLGVKAGYFHAAHCLLLSSTYFLFWETMSNCRDLNPSDITSFPTPDLTKSLAFFDRLSKEIEDDYTTKGRIIKMQNKLTGLVELESLTPAKSKPLLDRIDRLLAKHYGLTPDELDFIINYDIKYRQGKEEDEE